MTLPIWILVSAVFVAVVLTRIGRRGQGRGWIFIGWPG
jgi:hypothetical protein